jgi:hypothetical protein
VGGDSSEDAVAGTFYKEVRVKHYSLLTCPQVMEDDTFSKKSRDFCGLLTCQNSK